MSCALAVTPRKPRGKVRPTVLYHLTDSALLPVILREGLRPTATRGGSDLVYLADNRAQAMGYANHHGDWKGAPVLLEIDTAGLSPELLGPDDVDFSGRMGTGGQRTAVVSLRLEAESPQQRAMHLRGRDSAPLPRARPARRGVTP